MQDWVLIESGGVGEEEKEGCLYRKYMTMRRAVFWFVIWLFLVPGPRTRNAANYLPFCLPLS